nr:MAG TPA: hypothetical protein [Caudoviricetes sp.]
MACSGTLPTTTVRERQTRTQVDFYLTAETDASNKRIIVRKK